MKIIKNKLLKKIVVATTLLAMIASTSITAFATPNAWEYKASLLEAKKDFASASVNGKIYTFGGYVSTSSISGYYSTSVDEYNPLTNAWTRKGIMSSSRVGAKTAVVDGKIYLIGGHKSRIPVSTVEEYNPSTNTWTTKASMPAPKMGLGVAVVNGKIFTIGGASGNFDPLNTVEMYDPTKNTWTTKTSMPTTRTDMGAVALNGKIYVAGGSYTGYYPASRYSTLEVYDVATDTWTKKADMPQKLNMTKAEVEYGRIYVIGENNSNYFYEYNPETDSWVAKPNMLSSRANFSTSEVNGKIYALSDDINSGNQASMEMYEIASPYTSKFEAGNKFAVPSNLGFYSSDSQPILKWSLNGYTYVPCSYNDNRFGMAIAVYDSTGNLLGGWLKYGARYIKNITVDSTNSQVTFWGQSDNKIVMTFNELAQTPPSFAVSALSKIEAEKISNSSGIVLEDASEGGQSVAYIENGDYAVYNGIDFGDYGVSAFQASVASNTSGGNIEVRVDSKDGPIIGTCAVSGTGGWQNWTNVTCNTIRMAGTHNVYLTFTGGSGYLYNVNWFKFIY